MYIKFKKTFTMFFSMIFLLSSEGRVVFSSEILPGQDISSIAVGQTENETTLNAITFNLPKNLGLVNDRWQGNSAPVVVYIQDAHCNYEAQHKVAEIIGYVNEKYGVDTVDLEGGAGGYDLSVLTGVGDKVLRKDISNFFVKEGLLNGAEYFAANNPGKVRLWGVEDKQLYMENLAVYRASLGYKEKAKEHLKVLEHIMDGFKKKMFSPELLEIDNKYDEFKKNKLELKEYMSFLFETAAKCGVDTGIYPNISRLKEVSEKESTIDFRKADREKEQLLGMLQKTLSKRSIEELVVKTVNFKSERLSQSEYYAHLVKNAEMVNIPLIDLPELVKYVEYITIFDSVDKSAAMKELELIDEAVREKLYRSEGERELSRLSKNLDILEGIFDVSLVKSDYKYYLENEKSFDIERYEAFIRKYASMYAMEPGIDREIFSVDAYRKEMIKFFEYSFQRDDAFLRNLSVKSEGATPSGATILVTGGFHSENLSELFRKNNISYVSVMPNFRNPAGYENPYFALLAGGGSIISVLEPAVTAESAMQVASLFSGIAKDVWGDGVDKSMRAAVKVMEMKGVEYLTGISKVVYTDGKFTFTMKNGENDEWSREESAELKGETFSRGATEINLGVSPFKLYSWESGTDQIVSSRVSAEDIRKLVRGASTIPFVIVTRDVSDPDTGELTERLENVVFGDKVIHGELYGKLLSAEDMEQKGTKFYTGTLSLGAINLEENNVPETVLRGVRNLFSENNLIWDNVIAEDEKRTLLFTDPFSGEAMEYSKEGAKAHDYMLREFSAELKTGILDMISGMKIDEVSENNDLWRMLKPGYEKISETRRQQVIKKLTNWANQSERIQEVLPIEGIIDFYHVSTGVTHGGEKVVTVQLPIFEGWYEIFAASNRELYAKLIDYSKGSRLVDNFYGESVFGDRILVDLPKVEMIQKEILQRRHVFPLDSEYVTAKNTATFGNKAARIGDVGELLVDKKLPGKGSPNGFVITTETYREWFNNGKNLTERTKNQILMAIRNLQVQRRIEGKGEEFKVSVRSGAAVSLPGMMDTSLDIDVRKLQEGEEFTDAWENVLGEIIKVFESWESDRAILARRRNGISDNLGTAVLVQEMVSGEKKNEQKGYTSSFTGVMKTRDPKSGEKGVFGEYLENAKGKDLVDGSKTPRNLKDFIKWDFSTGDKREITSVDESEFRKDLYSQVEKWASALEEYYGYPQEIEFTIEDGDLYILQTRNANLTPQAQFYMLKEGFLEGTISNAEAIKKAPGIIKGLAKPSIKTEKKPLTTGIGTSPGWILGRVAFSRETVNKFIDEESLKAPEKRRPVIFVAKTTDVEDVDTMKLVDGVITLNGGMTSHAAGYTYRWNIPGVVGAESLFLEEGKLRDKDGKVEIEEGQVLGMDGSSGAIYYEDSQDYETAYQEMPSPLTREVQNDLLAIRDFADMSMALDSILSGKKTSVDGAEEFEFVSPEAYEDKVEIFFYGIKGNIAISDADREDLEALRDNGEMPLSVLRFVVVKKENGEYAFVFDFTAFFHHDIYPNQTHYAHGSIYFKPIGDAIGSSISIASPVTAKHFRLGGEDGYLNIHNSFLEKVGKDELFSKILRGSSLTTTVVSNETENKKDKRYRSLVGKDASNAGLIGKLYVDREGTVIAENIVTNISSDGKKVNMVSEDGSALYDENGNELEGIAVADSAISDEQRTEIKKKIDALRQKNSALGKMQSQYNSIMGNLESVMAGGSSILLAEDMPEGVFALPVTGTRQIVVSKAILDGILSGREEAILPMFHEAGEMMKGSIETETGITAHTFMRGCGQKVRDAISEIVNDGSFRAGMSIEEFFSLINDKLVVSRPGTPLTLAEINLMRFNLDVKENIELKDLTDEYASIYGGLQDRAFGKTVNEKFTKEYTSKEEARARASARAARSSRVINSLSQVQMKNSLVKTVVGVSGDIETEVAVEKLVGSVNREFANLGFGLVESTSYSQQGDKNQIITYTIVPGDPVKTEENYRKAVEKANKLLSEQLNSAKRSGLVAEGHIVLFAPHNDEMGLSLAENTVEEITKEYGNLTVVPDAYTDYEDKGETCPDILTRAVLARHIAFAVNGNNQDFALKSIIDFLNDISDEKVPEDVIKNMKDLSSVIKYLFINPLKLSSVFENFVQMQEAYHAVARSL